MRTRGGDGFHGVLVDARASLTLGEFSRACGIEVEVVRDLRVRWPGAAVALDLRDRLEEHERRLSS